MSARIVFLVAALTLYSLTQAAEKQETSAGGPKPLKGDYWVYGGELGDTVPPTKNDRKVAFTFRGPLAKELFDQIGPDNKDTCGAAPDHRIRDRSDLSCVWDKRDGYTCYFGLDVAKGKSTYGSIC
ncbi:hypothetical protein QPK32_08085 [Massilia sp. YIM B02763]|uniref:hypothetical protein n=1 Tax=Massilia sp. YIM B02763 TaxID=3050130 RepID=UPI0025B6E7A9|nr:hypothetical protein [Massilia sp. YIM B02763]MDN4053033.1 hypothetical protein [Massilia sp. YIM B02763]